MGGWPAYLDVVTMNKMFDSLGLHVVKSHLLPDTKGFCLCGGFVQLESIDEAAYAIQVLHGVPPLSMLPGGLSASQGSLASKVMAAAAANKRKISGPPPGPPEVCW